MKYKKIKIISVLSIVLVLGIVAVGVAIAGTDYSVEVDNREGFAQELLPDGAIVQYIGDYHETYGSSGTGTFVPFLRLQTKTNERGYNTDGTLEFDTKGGKWTHSILLSEIPTIEVGGLLYWEFWADINDNDKTPYISLDEFEIFFTNNPNLTGYPFGLTPFYYFNGDAPIFDDHILIKDVNQGSGRGDLRYLVPQDGFDAGDCNYGNPLCTTYLVLHTAFGYKGGDYKSDGGFEEWKVKKYPILQVSKDIHGAYDTPVTWTITKDYDAVYDLFTGESVAHKYQVSVNPIYGAPENTILYGTITIVGDDDDDVDATITDKFDSVPADILGCSVPENTDGTYTIAAKATVTCTYELELDAPVDGTNVARASYEMDTVKLAFEGSAEILEGDYVESFTGNPDIDVTDSNGEAWSTSHDSAVKSWTYELPFVCDADEGTLINTARIVGTDWFDIATVTLNCYDLEVTKTADEFYSRYFEWDITKSVVPESWALFTGESGTSDYTVKLDRTGFYENEWQVTGEITIANSHPSRDADLTQVLDNAGGITGVVTCGSSIVPAGDSLVCSYETAVLDAVDANPFGSTNTATATQQLYDFASDGAKTTGGTKDYAGSTPINFGEATVELVDEEATVSDTFEGSPVSGTYVHGKTFTYSRTFSCDKDEGQHDNIASFITNDTPLSGEDDASVTVDCYDLSVEKTTEEFYTRYYEWYIVKTVDDPGPITVQRGGSVDVNYTVEVGLLTVGGITENDWQVTGEITITNSHPSRDADLTQVVDDAGGITGVVTCGSSAVPADGSLVCSYATAVQNSVDVNPFGDTNTATATQQLYDFDSGKNATADGTKDYTGTAPIIFGDPTDTIDEKINVNDSYAGYLGTVNALTDTLPRYFTYTRTITAPDAVCGLYRVPNIAKFVTNDRAWDGWDDAFVIINVPCEGCTPGFWQGGAGSLLWDQVNDPQWVYGGTNPYIHTKLFNNFFSTETDARLDGQTMFQIVSNDGGSANPAEKAARDMVAAYLNESAFPGTFPPDSLAALLADWYAAVAGGDTALNAFHTKVGGWNQPPEGGYCPLP